jgi:hypothetical protein
MEDDLNLIYLEMEDDLNFTEIGDNLYFLVNGRCL